jgi:hypothetical protein
MRKRRENMIWKKGIEEVEKEQMNDNTQPQHHT